ncbi:MAG: DUF779 domain-containing protein [Chloroflexota bacterium]
MQRCILRVSMAFQRCLEEPCGQYHQHEGGYSNGADALCLPLGELRVGDKDTLLGTILGAPVFVYGRNAQDWDEKQFVLDAIDGIGTSFSLDSGTGKRFFVRSQAFEAA